VRSFVPSTPGPVNPVISRTCVDFSMFPALSVTSTASAVSSTPTELMTLERCQAGISKRYSRPRWVTVAVTAGC
jgi:hypothetical protein